MKYKQFRFRFSILEDEREIDEAILNLSVGFRLIVLESKFLFYIGNGGETIAKYNYNNRKETNLVH